ncbi:MAG: Vms1/Ankzf1 family peptidyl-tRNA hydrolase [Methanosarcinaceae archaeon]
MNDYLRMMTEKKKVVDNINVLFGKISGKEKLENQLEILQSHIVELEIDVKRLQTQFDKKESISKRAVSAKQEVESKLNEANIKIKTIMHERNAMKNKLSGGIRFKSIETVSYSRFPAYLSQIGSLRSDRESLITAYIKQGQSLSDLKSSEKILGYIDENSRYLLDKINSNTGYLLFYDTARMVCEAVAPTFAVKEPMWKFGKRFDLENIGMENRDLGICVVIIHAGESFVGFAPDKNGFETHKIIRSNVKSKHTKGGFSQGRFEKLRDEDIAHHVEKVQKAVKEVLDNYVGNIDYIITGGDHQLVKSVMADLAGNIPMIEKATDVKIEKHNTDVILESVLSIRRYLL